MVHGRGVLFEHLGEWMLIFPTLATSTFCLAPEQSRRESRPQFTMYMLLAEHCKFIYSM